MRLYPLQHHSCYIHSCNAMIPSSLLREGHNTAKCNSAENPMGEVLAQHTEDRVIGHNIAEKHFMDVENDDRIKQKDEGGYELPRQPSADEKFNYTLSRAREDLNVSPQESFLPDLLVTSPQKSANQTSRASGSAPTAAIETTEKTVSQNPSRDTVGIEVDLLPTVMRRPPSRAAPIELIQIQPMDSAATPIRSFTQVTPTGVTRSILKPDPPRAPVDLVMKPVPRVFEPPPALILDDDTDFPIVTQRDLPTVTTAQSVSAFSVYQSSQDISPTDHRISEIRQEVEQQSAQQNRVMTMSSASTDDSDENLPLPHVSKGRHAKRVRDELTSSNSSLMAVPATRQRLEDPEDARNHLNALRRSNGRGRSLDRQTIAMRSDSAESSVGEQSLMRDDTATPTEDSRDDDLLFRLIDETLLEEASAAPQQLADLAPPPYPVETSIPGLQLLEEDDSFYAGRPLRDVDTNNVSDILAIGDSMFHRVKFYNRNRTQAGKVSFGGGRIPEIKIYMQSTGRKKRSAVILCMGHNDLLKRKKKNKNISLEQIFKFYVAFIEWITIRCEPEVIFLCTLVPVKWSHTSTKRLKCSIRISMHTASITRM